MSRAYIFGSRVDFLIQDLFTHYVDEHGLVVQKDGDGGDCAYRTSLAAILLAVLLRPEKSKALIEALIKNCRLNNGEWIRHPDKKEWYSDPKTLSADQAAKIMLALICEDEKKLVFEWISKRALSLGFHQNTRRNNDNTTHWKMPDIIRPGEISNIIRGLDLWFLYPILLILDFRFLFDLYFRKKATWDYDSLMAVDLIYTRLVIPTPISEFATRIYIRTDYADRIRNNYNDSNNGIYPLGELYIIACQMVLEN